MLWTESKGVNSLYGLNRYSLIVQNLKSEPLILAQTQFVD